MAKGPDPSGVGVRVTELEGSEPLSVSLEPLSPVGLMNKGGQQKLENKDSLQHDKKRDTHPVQIIGALVCAGRLIIHTHTHIYIYTRYFDVCLKRSFKQT